MKRMNSWVVIIALTVAFLSGCGSKAATSPGSLSAANGAAGKNLTTSGGAAAPGAPAAEVGAAAPSDMAAVPAAQDQAAAKAGAGKPSDTKQGSAGTSHTENTTFVADPNHKIIKNGDLTVQVENVTIGINRITTVATANGGYILEVKSSDQSEQASTATLSFAVPVDHFEAAMQGVREASKKVLSEQSSGQDVSQEFVDIQSQIANLEATQTRVRTFLAQAKTVEEALKVNTQLSDLDGQISQLKGRLQFLSQRTAFSTITVQLQQIVGPTPTPTAEPTPTPIPWQTAATIQSASSTLRAILQGLATLCIWLGIVVAPLLIPLVLVWLLLRSLRPRTPRHPSTPPTVGGDGPPATP